MLPGGKSSRNRKNTRRHRFFTCARLFFYPYLCTRNINRASAHKTISIMKNTVFTLMTVLMLSTTTCFAQRGNYNNRQTYTQSAPRRGSYSNQDDMYGAASRQGRNYDNRRTQGYCNSQPQGYNRGGRDVVVVHQPPRVVEHVVVGRPAPCASVPPPPPPAPVPPHHHMHAAPAGVVAGAVIGTVIGAILSR